MSSMIYRISIRGKELRAEGERNFPRIGLRSLHTSSFSDGRGMEKRLSAVDIALWGIKGRHYEEQLAVGGS